MKIAILGKSPHTYTSKRLLASADALSLDVNFIPFTNCYMNICPKNPQLFGTDDNPLLLPDAIIPRLDAAHTLYGCAVLRQLEHFGSYSLNSAAAIGMSRDKLLAMQTLAQKNIPMPLTGFADSPNNIERVLDLVGQTPLLIKLCEGTQGKGNIFAHTRQAAISVINAFKQLHTNMMVQEYISEAEGSDIRCIVLGNTVLAAVRRQAKDRDRHITHNSVAPIALLPAERTLAIKALKALKLNFGSVDLIRANRGPLVVDFNPTPPLEAIERITGLALAPPIFQYVLANAKPLKSAI